MSIVTTVSCDVCEKKCEPQKGAGHFQGKIVRLAMEKENLNVTNQLYQFAQDFCPECSEVLLNFIVSFKKDVKTRRGDK